MAIDYALLIVTRHRRGSQAGLPPEEATVQAINTSGHAALFAGSTVCIALLGILARVARTAGFTLSPSQAPR